MLSPIENEDLDRLRLDRHRCAHPSMITLDDLYRPTAELARCHMRNAVEHLLSRPPVQGREAWDRIWADIESRYFPETAEEAEDRLRSRLSRARVSLVRKTVVELTRKLLLGADDRSCPRYFAALLATIKLHHGVVESLLQEKLPSLAEQVPDADLRFLLAYASGGDLAYGALGDAARGRLGAFVKNTKTYWVLSLAAPPRTCGKSYWQGCQHLAFRALRSWRLTLSNRTASTGWSTITKQAVSSRLFETSAKSFATKTCGACGVQSNVSA